MDSQLAYGGALALPMQRNKRPSPTVDQARIERDAAMESVAGKAGAEWAELALDFLESYARNNELFTPEDVTDAMVKAGAPQPHDLRAWGAVYQRARRMGFIKRSKAETYQRRFGHATTSFKWHSLICRQGGV